MSIQKVPGHEVFSPETSEIEPIVQERLENKYTILENKYGDICWNIESISISEITKNSSLINSQNAAQRESERAQANAKIQCGVAEPLIVVGEDNILFDGAMTLELLSNNSEVEEVLVYKGYSNTQETASEE